ncbi:MAG: hypothetical protein Q8P73_04140 [bacterium]|nr:hypothetical protein [bacterium]
MNNHNQITFKCHNTILNREEAEAVILEYVIDLIRYQDNDEAADVILSAKSIKKWPAKEIRNWLESVESESIADSDGKFHDLIDALVERAQTKGNY